MKELFRQMLDSTDPTVSHSRFLSIITTLTVLYTWAWCSIYARAILDIPVGVYTFAGLVIAGTIGNKAFDKMHASTETEGKKTTGDFLR